jgi:hypothetical protein
MTVPAALEEVLLRKVCLETLGGKHVTIMTKKELVARPWSHNITRMYVNKTSYQKYV